MKLTDFQESWLRLIDKGYGLSANPKDFDHAWERRELEELVEAGLIRKTKNHSGDRYGCYYKLYGNKK